MKTLIFGGVHITNERAGNLMRTALALAEKLNPGVDFLLVDNGSPLDPRKFLDESWNDTGFSLRDGLIPTIGKGKTICRFTDSIGHFFWDADRDPPPKDGPGRGIMTALQVAMKSGYDRAVYMEPDCLFARPIEDGFKQMTKPIGFLPRTPWGYLDNQVWWFADLKWLKEYDYVGKYDWPNRVGDRRGEPPGEVIHEQISGDHFDVLPFKGCRTSQVPVKAHNIRHAFPDGVDFITHADRDTFAAFLEMNGHAHLIPLLGTTPDYNAMGMALCERINFHAAKTAFIKGLHVQKRPDILANLANTYRRLWMFSEARDAIEQSLELNPARGRSWWVRALLELDMHDVSGSLASHKRALELNPELPDIRFTQAVAKLHAGQYLDGFKDYDSRLKLGPQRPTTLPTWRGEELGDKTVIVEMEQGMGDCIMFARYVDMIPGNAVIRCPPPLLRYFRNQGYQAIHKAVEYEADYIIPSMSLPVALGVDGCPPPAPFNPPEPMTIEGRGKFNIGIVWRSKASGMEKPEALFHGEQKSCPLEYFLQLAEIPGVQLYSLQSGPAAEDINRAKGLVQPTLITDFEDLAGYMANMDLVVSVDTGPIHLAGAMGKPGVVLLNCVGSWQWQSGHRTPWYPSLQIVRQPKPHAWQAALDFICRYVEQLL